MYSSTLTSAGGGLAWPACYFQVEEYSTHLLLWEANARFLYFQLDGNMAEEGRKRKEIKLRNWKAVSYHLPHYSDRRISVTLSSIPSICPPPSAPACRKQQRGRGGASLPSHLGHQAEPRSLVGVCFWHVACVLCRAGPSSLAVWTFWVCQQTLHNGEVNPISCFCLLW